MYVTVPYNASYECNAVMYVTVPYNKVMYVM